MADFLDCPICLDTILVEQFNVQMAIHFVERLNSKGKSGAICSL